MFTPFLIILNEDVVCADMGNPMVMMVNLNIDENIAPTMVPNKNPRIILLVKRKKKYPIERQIQNN
jgi:hypothetical protein